jgi:hypothetical protein
MISRQSLIAVAALGVLSGPAAASPESDKLFREGRELLKAGKIAEACEAFADSQKLEAKVGTLLNLADCREKQGQTATAWSLFLEAKQLAVAQHAPREAEAEAGKRALAIQARLSYLTITIARERQVDGLVIKRNGRAVDRAQWNTPVAVDPGDQVIEASAPKFISWSRTQALGVKQKATVVVEALAAEPIAEPASPAPGAGAVVPAASPGEPPSAAAVAVEAPRLPSPPVRPLAVGLMLGSTSDQDTVFGGRVSGGLAVPQGAVRAIASMLYTSFADDSCNPDSSTQLFALGGSVDYVWMPVPQLAFAAGLGLGTDIQVKNLDREGSSAGWWTLRASPVIVRFLAGRLEAGLHVQYVRTSDRGVVLGLAAIDLFPL